LARSTGHLTRFIIFGVVYHRQTISE
jgi:hypothetical protein